MKRTELITVAKLIKDLKRFEKTQGDANVTCCLPDGTLCYAVNVRKDEDGDICLCFEEDEEDSGCYEVKMLLSELEGHDSRTRAYMEASGLYMTFAGSKDGKLFTYDDEEYCVCCDGEAIGEYEVKQYSSAWHTEAEKRMLEERARKEKRQHKIEYGVLLALIIIVSGGFLYNLWASVTLSGDSLWKNILWGVVCLFLSIVGAVTLVYNKK